MHQQGLNQPIAVVPRIAWVTHVLRASSPMPAQIGCVTYYAISGATQTGPNIFWTLASLRYAATSGNYTWLKDHLPNLRHAMSFLTNLYDPTYHLLSVPGSLFIDTFKRYNLTTDSNGAMVCVSGVTQPRSTCCTPSLVRVAVLTRVSVDGGHRYLLNQFADAEDFVGNSTGAEDMRAMASTIAAAMNKYLWAPSNDHYVVRGLAWHTAGVRAMCAVHVANPCVMRSSGV